MSLEHELKEYFPESLLRIINEMAQQEWMEKYNQVVEYITEMFDPDSTLVAKCRYATILGTEFYKILPCKFSEDIRINSCFAQKYGCNSLVIRPYKFLLMMKLDHTIFDDESCDVIEDLHGDLEDLVWRHRIDNAIFYSDEES